MDPAAFLVGKSFKYSLKKPRMSATPSMLVTDVGDKFEMLVTDSLH